MLVHRRVTPNIKFSAGTHLYTWAERETVRVKCLAHEHNAMSPVRSRTRTARSGVERTNHEATAPPFHLWVAEIVDANTRVLVPNLVMITLNGVYIKRQLCRRALENPTRHRFPSICHFVKYKAAYILCGLT